MIPFFCDETDDPEFIDPVSDITNGLLVQSKVAGAFTVKVRDWFGPNWLGFGGKVLGAVPVHRWPIVLPPFHPNRILSQRFYAWHPEEEQYIKDWPPMRLHVRQESSSNLTSYVRNYIGSGALVWFSSGSKTSANGALMVYLQKQGRTGIWYAGLTRGKNGWRWRGDMVSDVELSAWCELGKAERLKTEPLPSPAGELTLVAD